MINTISVPQGLLRIFFAFITCSAMTIAQAQDGPPQRIIVKYRTTTASSAATSRSARTMSDATARFGIGLSTVRKTTNGAQILKLSGNLSKADVAQLVKELAADPNVEFAEEDQLMQAFVTPNDPSYSSQWHYYETAGGLNLPTAWDSATGVGQYVAVIDTGYRPHADLAANLVGGYDFISDTFVSNDGNLRDSSALDPGDWTTTNYCYAGWAATNSSWHGTHVAGTIAAVTNNSVGVAGVAYGAKVVPLRVLGKCGGYNSDIADAIAWSSGATVSGVPANPYPAKVASLSLGGRQTCPSVMQTAINTARSRGTIVVVAAGNSQANASAFAPANCTGVIVVASVNRSGGRAWYSNFGAIVDVAAPGGDTSSTSANGVLSTLNTGTTTPGSDTYVYYQGTSMATPHVSGAAALMFSVNPSLTPDQIESLLKSSSRAFPATCGQCGSGIVNAAAAVAAATP